MISRTMRPRAMAPFALTAVLVAVGSSVLVLSTAHESAIAPPASLAPAATASGAPRPLPELSRASRLAFWRDGKLWVSDLDGSLRQAIAATDDIRRVSLTRWTTDGSAVTFVDSGLSLAVVGTDGARRNVDLPADLRSAGYRIADVRWSPDGRRAAATLLRPADGRSDAFLADLAAPRAAWTRLTTLDDLFVSDWISNDELLAYTAAGVIAVVGTREMNAIRLLAGTSGIAPIVGPEGRIHFLAGRAPFARDISQPFVTASRASVWSAATDGSDVRREASWELSDVRLDARLPDGRYLLHRGSSAAQAVVAADVELLPAGAGVIERVRIAPDGRTAFGFTIERIVRIDLTKLQPGPVTADTAVSVFLDASGGSDIWFPSQLSLARGGERSAGGPAARYAFSLGGHVWQMRDGIPWLLRIGPLFRRTQVPAPRWSPDGDHLVVVEQAGTAFASTTFIAVSIDRSGTPTRLEPSIAAARSLAWSPDGGELAIVVDGRGVSGIGADPQLEIRFLDPSGRRTRTAIPGAEVAWTATGILFLAADPEGKPAVQRIQGDGPARTVVLRERLVGDPRAEASRTATAVMSALDAPPDGSYASVRLQTSDAGTTRSYLVVVGADGRPVRYLRAENVADVTWAPRGALLGYTLDVRTATERAVVASAAGDAVTTLDGRFAGWSPDGRSYLIARQTGLFAYAVGGGPAVRVGPVGVPVSVAAADER